MDPNWTKIETVNTEHSESLKSRRSKCFGNLEGMPEERAVKRVFKNIPEG
jgi:hypothetical protein